MKRKLTTVLPAALAAGMMMTGCGSSNTPTETKDSAAAGTTAADAKAATEAAKSGEVTTIRFYGSDSEYNQNIVAGFQAENPDIFHIMLPLVKPAIATIIVFTFIGNWGELMWAWNGASAPGTETLQ